MTIRTVAPSRGSREPTDLQTYGRFPQRPSVPSDLHTFTPPRRVKPKNWHRGEGEACSTLHVSFFDWAKNETRKTHSSFRASSSAAPFATPTGTSSLCSRRGTNRKGPKGHPVDSPAKRAQTRSRSRRGSGFALETTNRARPGGTYRPTNLQTYTQFSPSPSHPFPRALPQTSNLKPHPPSERARPRRGPASGGAVGGRWLPRTRRRG